MILGLVSSFVIGLCWGSFINMLAYRMLHGASLLTKRSYCPSCKKTISWYDNIPLLSWALLRGHCRACKHAISQLYPLIELLAGLCAIGLYLRYMTDGLTFFSWVDLGPLATDVLLLTALLAATRTDLEAMLIPQAFSIWLVPVGIGLTLLGLTTLTIFESILGACVGYGLLALIGAGYRACTGRDGLGTGDMELLAMIGSFTGPVGVWAALTIGSFSGLAAASLYLLATGQHRLTRIPFGPFLALGTLMYLFWGQSLLTLILG